jgi:hypothetical protein
MTHPSHSPIAPGSLTSDLTAMDARHLAVDRPSRAPSDQINPSTFIPYPHPCLPTSPITRNRNHGGEPPRNLVGGRFFRPRPVRPLPRPTTRRRQPPPPSGTWAHAHGAVPHWRAKLGRLPARPHARPYWAESPPGPASRKLFIFFFCPFLFLFFIYMFIY